MNKKIIPLVSVSDPIYQNRQVLSKFDVASDHLWTFDQRSMNFNKDLNLKGQYCYHPFNTITVDSNGNVFVCVCQAWLPVSVGKIWQFESLQSIVHSPKAREIQASIIDGSYRYCDHHTCSIINEKELKQKINHRPDNVNWINFSLDSSCNLTCPSCRTEFKFVKDGPEFDLRMQIVDHLVKLIENHNHELKFTLAGDGDPFASIVYRRLLEKLNLESVTADIEIELVTNGVLLSSHWHKLKKIHKNIVRTKISFDAGTENIYNITRRGGDWNKLISGCKYLYDWKLKNHSNMTMTANFVVQSSNYKEMIDYITLCDLLGFDEINFQKIDNWGTFNNFNSHAVWKESHPMHQDFLTYINDPAMENKKINLTNLSHFKNESK